MTREMKHFLSFEKLLSIESAKAVQQKVCKQGLSNYQLRSRRKVLTENICSHPENLEKEMQYRQLQKRRSSRDVRNEGAQTRNAKAKRKNIFRGQNLHKSKITKKKRNLLALLLFCDGSVSVHPVCISS
jgi:hypothetical protein